MKTFKTLLLGSLVAGIVAPVFADANNDLYREMKKNGEVAPQWLVEAVFGPAQPAGDLRVGGDTPATATPIPFSPSGTFTDAGTTLGSSDFMTIGVLTAPTSCNYSFFTSSSFGAGDAWYSFVLAEGYEVEVATCNDVLGSAGYDSCLGIFDSAMNLVAVSDDGAGCTSYSSWIEACCLNAGTYYIAVDGYGSAEGAYELVVNFGAEPCIIVDPCDTWTCESLSLPAHGFGDNTGLVDYFGSSAGDQFFCFTLTEESYVELQTCFAGTLIDTDSYWWIGGGPCDAGATYLGYNDGESACDWATHVIFDCEAPLPAGDYVVAISGYSTSEGAFEYDITATPCAVAEAVEVPVAMDLGQNYPNPFNPTTTIDFTVENTNMVNLSVFSITGQKVATLVNDVVESGSHSVIFDASELTSGVYFYTLEANGVSSTQKMILMK